VHSLEAQVLPPLAAAALTMVRLSAPRALHGRKPMRGALAVDEAAGVPWPDVREMSGHGHAG
jgi:hypothetical protein